MPKTDDIGRWVGTIRSRYESYLKTSFYFKDSSLRESFQSALQGGDLLKGPFAELSYGFQKSITPSDLADECFQDKSSDLLPALLESKLYVHQEHAIRRVHMEQQNVVVATGTASGKTESFLYPILFELYRQHLMGQLDNPGVRAMILYPMNALANDQRERLGEICKNLKDAGSSFAPTFGQYTGQTPEDRRDNKYRNAALREEEKLDDELIFRKDMRATPPHILLTNYSMLEYLLIRPDDSPLFDGNRGEHWQFIVLDEAHQYRGTKGMEMGMLIRRLKQRLRGGGRQNPFRCIATSATISSSEGTEDKQAVAEFAGELFAEPFTESGIIFGEHKRQQESNEPRRYHIFVRALEGAFLIHKEGQDAVTLNRKAIQEEDGIDIFPLEIALCKECGQHYYVGRHDCHADKLVEAVRDPSQPDFGVEYYLPLGGDDNRVSHNLCRRCGKISVGGLDCECGAAIPVKKCEPHKEHPDQLKQCEVCGYQRGGIGDPVQEIVYGSDGPNAVIATALHGLLPENGRKVLAFADSRQEAAFFAWYAEKSYQKLRDRNLMLRALSRGKVAPEGLSIEDFRDRLVKQWNEAGLFDENETRETQNRIVLAAILGEALTNERRISLAGVGLIKWSVKIPDRFVLPDLTQAPWNLTESESHQLLNYFLDELRQQRALTLPDNAGTPSWSDITQLPQQSYCHGSPRGRRYVREWGGKQSSVVKHFLYRLLSDSTMSDKAKQNEAISLMGKMWEALRERDRAQSREDDWVLSRANSGGVFRLNHRWLRINLVNLKEIWECDTCASLSSHNIRGICARNGCHGNLVHINIERLEENHYRVLYKIPNLPHELCAAEHTAQISSDEARIRQNQFKAGKTHLLSSSTTFEVGVDLGNLESVFLRNVPPEPFNYVQRVGRAGRRETPGMALTYCRRNSHDLYHYENPERRMIKGEVQPPRLHMTNEKIIYRHMVAVALSAFFKETGNKERFKNLHALIGDWSSPSGVSSLRQFCESTESVKNSLLQVVPESIYEKVGLTSDNWIINIVGQDSRFAWAEAEVCGDYRGMEELVERLARERPSGWTSKINRLEYRMRTIAGEPTLNFLSRKAVIPKYGFPVDVVELDTHAGETNSRVSLQRDLSQAIAEYAPGGKVIANKLEWESCGVKTVPGRQFPVKYYSYDDARNFQQYDESDPEKSDSKKYLSPIFGFVTPLFKRPREPYARTRRLYTTRPFFPGFDSMPEVKEFFGVKVTQAIPGSLIILCEGHGREGFYICRSCGKHMTQPEAEHKTPMESNCPGTLEKFRLGHELVTDVVRLQFPQLSDQWDAYSLAYAILLGVAEQMEVPDTDLNVTIAGGDIPGEATIILYDNVPGGAGLVAQLEREDIFKGILGYARERVQGGCGCDSSCYGCLRSYRNQFAHPYLNREKALSFLDASMPS